MIRVCMRPMELATLQSLHIPISESFSPNPTTPNLSKTCWFGLMAQKTEKEETEFKVPESLASTSGIGGGISSCSNTTQQKKVEILTHGRSRNERIKLEVVRRNEPAGSDPVKKAVNRCDGCNRKVGLTGFRCRCGELFCWEHRYSDRHDCSFDYKTAGREAIARENPVVKAAKILRV